MSQSKLYGFWNQRFRKKPDTMWRILEETTKSKISCLTRTQRRKRKRDDKRTMQPERHIDPLVYKLNGQMEEENHIKILKK